MPHSGGGGSHSGGSHSGGSSSHSSSGGGSSTPSYRTSRKYFAGARRYVVYTNNTYEEYYSNNPRFGHESKPGWWDTFFKHFAWLVIIIWMFIMPVIAGLFSLFISCFSIRVPVVQPKNNEILIEDNACIIEDKSTLKAELEKFRDITGVVPAVITEYDYTTNWYSSLENYAYDAYVSRWSDEKHYLVVISYSSYTRNDTPVDWAYETMVGDDIGSIIKTDDENTLVNIIQEKMIYYGDDYRVDKVIIESFHDFRNVVSPGFKINVANLIIFIVITGALSIFVYGINIIVKKKNIQDIKEWEKRKTAVEIKPNEDHEIIKCDYCGGTYISKTVTACPHCGAPVNIG